MLEQVQYLKDSHDTSISHLTQALSSHDSGYILFFSTDRFVNDIKTVIGAYFPSALNVVRVGGEKTRGARAKALILIFFSNSNLNSEFYIQRRWIFQ